MQFTNKNSGIYSSVKQIVLYGSVLGFLIVILKVIEYKFWIRENTIELYIGALALLFTILGIWMGLKLTKKIIVEKIIHVASEFQMNKEALKKLNISPREYEVLQLMADGLSNNEIAEKLFVSLNTIKTHTASLFIKLDASRRTQAVSTAKALFIIP